MNQHDRELQIWQTSNMNLILNFFIKKYCKVKKHLEIQNIWIMINYFKTSSIALDLVSSVATKHFRD